MSMQLSNSKLRQAQLKPDRATCSHYLPLSTPSHSSVEQQPGLALAQSPLLSCFPASLRLGQDTHCVMQSHQMRSRRSPLAHTHTQTHTDAHSTRLSRWLTHGERHGEAAGSAEATRKCKKCKKHALIVLGNAEVTNTHTRTHTRARGDACEWNYVKADAEKYATLSRARLQLTRFRFPYPLPPSLSSLLAVRLCLVLIGNHMLSAYIKIVINLNKQETG